jgi:hypothetical protein
MADDNVSVSSSLPDSEVGKVDYRPDKLELEALDCGVEGDTVAADALSGDSGHPERSPYCEASAPR